MSLTSQLRATLLIAVLPLVQIGCASVPQVESRLQTWQLSPTVYSARPGDTLATVAFRYKIDEAQLRAMNPQLPDQLVTGQRVVVHQPFDAQSAVQTASAAPIQNPGGVRAPNQALPSRTTITPAVQPTQIYPAPQASVPFDQIREIPANAVSSTINSRGGQLPIEEVVPDDLDATLGYNSLPIVAQQPINTPAVTQTIIQAPQGNKISGWVWPTWGEIAREFAPNEAGGHGIDIAGVPGQEIHAASGGTIAYAGRDLTGGDGKLIIIRHHSGLMTTYSHARQLFVAEDDVVRAGDVIASLGANARNESVLRFEVRQDGNPLNPMNFLTN